MAYRLKVDIISLVYPLRFIMCIVPSDGKYNNNHPTKCAPNRNPIIPIPHLLNTFTRNLTKYYHLPQDSLLLSSLSSFTNHASSPTSPSKQQPTHQNQGSLYILSPTQTIHYHNKGNPSKISIDSHYSRFDPPQILGPPKFGSHLIYLI